MADATPSDTGRTAASRPARYRPGLSLRQRRRLGVLADAGSGLGAAVVAAAVLGAPRPSASGTHLWLLALASAWPLVLAMTGMYTFPRHQPMTRNWGLLSASGGWLFVAVLVASFALREPPLPRSTTLGFLATAVAGSGAWRTLWAWIGALAPFRRRVILAGSSDVVGKLHDALRSRPTAGYDAVAAAGPDDDGPWPVPRVGGVSELPEIVTRIGAAEVVLAADVLDQEVVDTLFACRRLGVTVTSGAEVIEHLAGRVAPEHISDPRHLAVAAPPSRAYPGLKRAIDVLCAAVGLGVLMIILPVLAVAIRLDSRGPVFYRQGRVGLDGRTFTIWKLRTMREEPEREPTLTRPNDPRITRVGRWLRRMHLDELPQFWNVLLGDMSLIGPRPEPAFEAEATTAIPLYPLRYAVRPGLVGWAAIHHPYVDSLDGARTRLEYDLYYIRHRSLWLDLQILVRASILWMAPKGR